MAQSSNFFSPILKQMREKFLDIMAIVVAVIAIVISTNQGKSQNELTLSNWRPMLAMEYIKSDSAIEKGLLIKNVGFGPAIIQSFRYYRNEEDYQKKISYQEWLNDSGFSRSGILLGFRFVDINYFTRGYVLANRTEGDLFLLGTKANNYYGSDTDSSLQKVIVEIEYSSIASADKHTYYLRFCENFLSNNITDPDEKNIYESDNEQNSP
jgi:hypothetical protein